MSGIDFYVQSLNVDVTSTTAAISGGLTASFTSDVHATMDIDLTVAKNLFRFHTDGTEILDASSSDITYRVNYTNVDLETTPTDPVLTSAWLSDVDVVAGGDDDVIYPAQSGLDNQKVTYEYVRYLARKLFNTHLGVDLFSNEQELRDDLHFNAKVAMNAHLTHLTDISNNDTEADNTNYISANQATAGDFELHHHPSYSILQHIIQAAPDRLSDISGNLASDTDPAYSEFMMPFIAGDKIYFQLTVNAAAGQESVTDVAVIPLRTYRIQMNIVGSV